MDHTLVLSHPMVRRFIDRAALNAQQEREAMGRGDRVRYTASGDARLAWHSAAVSIALDVLGDAETDDAELRGAVWQMIGSEITATADRWDRLPDRTVATPLT